MKETANSLRSVEENSTTMVLMLESRLPIPRPVNTRNSASSPSPLARLDANIPSVMTTSPTKVSQRRPLASATGERKSDPTVMPSNPALNCNPNCVGITAQSRAMVGPVKVVASTSKPSSIITIMQIVTAAIWKPLIGPRRSSARGSSTLFLPSARGSAPATQLYVTQISWYRGQNKDHGKGRHAQLFHPGASVFGQGFLLERHHQRCVRAAGDQARKRARFRRRSALREIRPPQDGTRRIQGRDG